MDDKVIVTNRRALTAKYGAAGLVKIKAAVDKLIAADAKRGIKARLIFLDDAAAMKGAAVTDPADPRQNKVAIDKIYAATNAQYVMILGSIDVVPHQDLMNPVFDGNDDPDKYAYGDLPYACDAPYSRDIANFKGPTRVVGRLPDLTGARSPSHLLNLLSTAANYRSRPAKDYGGYFGLSTQSWRKSTGLSLFNVFGANDKLVTSPKNGPRHAAGKLAPLAHFINCHGGSSDPAFYGEGLGAHPPQPESLTSDAIKRKIKRGTVAAVECCYGAQLYDSVTLSLPLPIAQHYLMQGAYGYFGSTSIAYGPEEGNGSADLIAQYFLLAIMEGASIGRAALTARQKFVEQTAELDPMDIKTLGQFNLLGDPSIQPVKVDNATTVPKGANAMKARSLQREERRTKMRSTGRFLDATKPTASRETLSVRRSPTVRKALANIARVAGIQKGKAFRAYDVKVPMETRSLMRKAGASGASRYYVAVFRKKAEGNVIRSKAAVAKEVDGRIVGYRVYVGK